MASGIASALVVCAQREHSWWRLDGYGTDVEPQQDEEDEAEDEKQGMGMAVDDDDE